MQGLAGHQSPLQFKTELARVTTGLAVHHNQVATLNGIGPFFAVKLAIRAIQHHPKIAALVKFEVKMESVLLALLVRIRIRVMQSVQYVVQGCMRTLKEALNVSLVKKIHSRPLRDRCIVNRVLPGQAPLV